MLFSLSTLGEVAREKDVDDVERAKDVQLYDLAQKQKCPESGNWQQSTSSRFLEAWKKVVNFTRKVDVF